MRTENEKLKEQLSIFDEGDPAKIKFKEGSYGSRLSDSNIMLRSELEKTRTRYINVEEKFKEFEFRIQNYIDKISTFEKEISNKDKEISSLRKDYSKSVDDSFKEYKEVEKIKIKIKIKIKELEEELRLEKNKK